MMTPRDRLIQDVEIAFATVERGAGLTLHEAAAFEGNDASLLRIPAANLNTA